MYKDAVYETHQKTNAKKHAKETLDGELASLQVTYEHQPIDDHDIRESAEAVAKAMAALEEAKRLVKQAKDRQKQVGEDLRASRSNATL